MIKQEKVLKKLREIENKIKKSKLIDKIIYITKEHGSYKTQEESCHVKVWGDYNKNNLNIHYESGLTMFGGGEIKVAYGGESVFVAKENRDKDENDFNPYIGGRSITRYLPGTWEKEVISLSKKKKEKIKPIVEKKDDSPLVIPNETLEELAANFNIK